MKVIEVIKLNREPLKLLYNAGIRLSDLQYANLYEQYQKMASNGDKVSYIVMSLSIKYGISERKVYSLLKLFKTDCKIDAAYNNENAVP